MKSARFAVSLFVVATIATAPRALALDGCAGADLLLHNGKIVTMNDQRAVVDAMAVRDGIIVAIGGHRDVRKCAGNHTQTVDLGGKMVLPGLIDIHTHALEWAKSMVRGELDLNYPKVRSVESIVSQVRERAKQLPAGEWILGFGWDDAKLQERRYVTRQDLDQVTTEQPVYLVHVSGHLAVANSEALRLAGITRDTPDPVGGVIEKDTQGNPTGIVKDTAMALVGRLLPPEPPGLARKAAKVVSEKALEVGLTSIHDIWLSPDDMQGYQDASAAGELKVRVQMVPRVRNVADAKELVKMGVHTGFGNDHLRLGGVKMFADGGMGARTIAIYAPGVQGEPQNVGLLLWKSEDMQEAHRILASAGWQLITHAIGDRAIDQVLDSYATTETELKLEAPRFRIAHCGISTPAIQRRLRELKVMVDGNPPFVYWIGSWFRKYGPERVRWSYPSKSYFENGIVAGAGSDVGVTPISPWWGLWAAVVRKEMETGEVLAPEERLAVLEALQLYTRNGAYIGWEEKKKGSLEVGKLADFVIVDRDILLSPADELQNVRVLSTYVDGQAVFRAQ